MSKDIFFGTKTFCFVFFLFSNSLEGRALPRIQTIVIMEMSGLMTLFCFHRSKTKIINLFIEHKVQCSSLLISLTADSILKLKIS